MLSLLLHLLLLLLLLHLLLRRDGGGRRVLRLQLAPKQQGRRRLRLNRCLQQLRSHGWGPQHARHRVGGSHQPRAILLQRLGSRRTCLPIQRLLRPLLLAQALVPLLLLCKRRCRASYCSSNPGGCPSGRRLCQGVVSEPEGPAGKICRPVNTQRCSKTASPRAVQAPAGTKCSATHAFLAATCVPIG